MIPKGTAKKGSQSQESLHRSLSKDEISQILGTVTFDRAFYFYDAVGKPNGNFAVSLSDFCSKINVVSSESVAFHLKRRDFQKWISDIIGDVDLANRLDKIKVKNNALKSTVHAFVSSRIKELQDSWPILLTVQ